MTISILETGTIILDNEYYGNRKKYFGLMNQKIYLIVIDIVSDMSDEVIDASIYGSFYMQMRSFVQPF